MVQRRQIAVLVNNVKYLSNTLEKDVVHNLGYSMFLASK